MPYTIAPFNIAAGILVIFAIYSIATAPTGGDGLSTFWVIPMLILALAFVGLDYFLQANVANYWKLFAGEVIAIVLLIALAYFNGFLGFLSS